MFRRADRRRADHRRTSLRDAQLSTTQTIRALCDLGESICSGVHVIYSPLRMYLCVSMEPKPEALQAQRLADKRAAAGMFAVDEAWSAAEVNRRWARRAVLTDSEGNILEEAMRGARGLTDVGRGEAFFEYNAMERYPEQMYLQAGDTRVKVR
ncbi:MAG: hypothetical protein J6K32_09000 [Clostridia bacterium]|nr:hypothetical protein [Clostridia bacterium]